MTEIVLTGVIIILSGLLVWKEKQAKEERTKFINAVLAKSPQEFKDLEFVSKLAPEPQIPPDLVPVEELTDSQWEKVVLNGK